MPETPTDRDAGRLLVFVHIPKTAGTTLRTVLSMNEPGARSKALGNVFKGGGGVSPELVARLREGGGLDVGGVRLLRGHVPLGIREYLPNSVPRKRSLRFFTFLRDPVDRTLSHYFRILEAGAGYDLPPLPPGASVEATIEGGYIHDNLHTRMLSGLPEPFGEVDESMLAQAKRNLSEGLAFFGLTERFDESLVLAKRRLGLRTILYPSHARVNTARPRGDAIPPELRAAAEQANRYDIELYRYASELFEAQPELAELEFAVELAALRAAKAEGAIDLEVPAPEGFEGGEAAWRMLLEARAKVLRLEWEVARGQPQRAWLEAPKGTDGNRTAAPATLAPEPAVATAPARSSKVAKVSSRKPGKAAAKTSGRSAAKASKRGGEDAGAADRRSRKRARSSGTPEGRDGASAARDGGSVKKGGGSKKRSAKRDG